MQRYRHYGTSYSSSTSSAVPVEELHAEEEEEVEEVYTEEEAELLTQEETQEAGRTDVWVDPLRFGLGSDLVWFGLVRRRRGGAAAGGGGGAADEEGRAACHRGDRWEQPDRTGSEWLYWFGVVRTGLAPVLVLVFWRPGCAADWFDLELLLLALAVLACRGHTAALSLCPSVLTACLSPRSIPLVALH